LSTFLTYSWEISKDEGAIVMRGERLGRLGLSREAREAREARVVDVGNSLLI
jgi:hypothetical protein